MIWCQNLSNYQRKIILYKSSEIYERIFTIRNIQVMIDRDLAELYEVETKVFNQTVKRNLERSPINFRFKLTRKEYEEILMSQFVTSSLHSGRRYLPYAFTEQGVAMLYPFINVNTSVDIENNPNNSSSTIQSCEKNKG